MVKNKSGPFRAEAPPSFAPGDTMRPTAKLNSLLFHPVLLIGYLLILQSEKVKCLEIYFFF